MIARAALASLRPSLPGALLFVAALALGGSGAVQAGVATPVIVDNGTVALGVDPDACLNVPIVVNGALTGLLDLATGQDGTRGGAPIEGWGIADLNLPRGGGAMSQVLGIPLQNLIRFDWGVSGSGTLGAAAGHSLYTLHSLELPLDVGPVRGGNTLLLVRHDFRPSASSYLYEIEVTVTNNYVAAVRPRYRRLVEWDAEPTAFSEWVTIEHGPSGAVVASVGNFPVFPFDPNPLVPVPTVGAGPVELADSPQAGRAPLVPCPVDASFVDCGPGDQAAAIDFEFPEIPPGGTLKFWLYYGTAPDEATALAALGEVGASAYSLAQSVASDPTVGEPVTFVFGFKEPWLFEEDFEADTICNWSTALGTTEVCSNWCGDGALQFGEECDDGNLVDDDGCTDTCQLDCGDGETDAGLGEECDDGNLTPGDGCDATCQLEPYCGNGVLDPGEQCDDGNSNEFDACDNACFFTCLCPAFEQGRAVCLVPCI